jgi:hypothetical protein
MEKNIILISVGVFQEYIKDNIEQLIKLKFTNIHVITNKCFFDKLKKNANISLIDSSELNIDYYNKKTKQRGFWDNCSKRLFLLYEYMKKYNIKNVIHLENDVLLYNKLDYNFENKVYLTMDDMDRCIPGIMFIPSYELLNNLIQNYIFTTNDMKNCALFYKNNKDIVKTFPIIDDSIDKCIYNENYKEFSSIFDAAAIGQYLGGVDPRNIPRDTRGFVNETCVIKYNKYNFKWLKKNDYEIPFIEINKKLIPINNLHIHCKNLKKFSIINNINMNNINKLNNFF